MPSQLPSFHVRLPAALKKRLEAVAAANNRSINAELQARLERSFDLDAADRGKALQLISEAATLLQKGS
jgi:plasmid stability protein